MALYDAFVSYSHAKDKPIAAALQSVVQKLGKPWYRRRALRLFRDDTSLSATPGLWPTIEQALGQSRYLILLASPEAAASPWVNKEVVYWLEHKGADTLLIAVTDGELAWDNKIGDFGWREGMPLPPVLTGRFASEPKWVDLRAYRDGADKRDAKFTELAADFAAAIHGMPKEDLLSQEVRQQRRALTLAWSAACSLLVLAGLAGWQWKTAVDNERAATEQKQIAQAQRDRAVQAEGTATEQKQIAQTQRDRAEKTLATATKTANDLVFNLAQEFRDQTGMPVSLTRKILDRARELQKQLTESGESSPDLKDSEAAALSALVKTLLAQGDAPAAFAAAERGRELMELLMALNPENKYWQSNLSLSYAQLGDVLVEMGKRADAVAAYQKALDTGEKLAASNPADAYIQGSLAEKYENFGVVLMREGRREDALKAHGKSVAILESIGAPDPRSQWTLSRARGWIGDLFLLSGEREKALESFLASVEAMKNVVASSPTNASAQRDLATSYDRLGQTLRFLGRLDEAIEAHAAGVRIGEAVVSADLGNAVHQSMLSVGYEKYYHALRQAGRRDQAREILDKLVAIREKIASADPDNTRWQHLLATAYIMVGDNLCGTRQSISTSACDTGKDEEALLAYRKSQIIWSKLNAIDPGNFDWKADLSAVYSRTGTLAKKAGRLDESLTIYDRSLKLNEQVAAADPNDINQRQGLGISNNNVAEALFALGRAEEALSYFDEAIRIARSLTVNADPKVNAARYLERAEARFYLDQPLAALEDVQAAVKLDPQEPYHAVWLHVIRMRLGQDDSEELARNASKFDHGKWPWPLIAFYLGQSSVEELRAGALTAEKQRWRDANVCEADFHLGLYQLEKGAAADARQLLQSVLDRCRDDPRRGTLAAGFLKRLDGTLQTQDANAIAVTQCDRLAASNLDPDLPASIPGVPVSALKANLAVPACEAALQAVPDNRRIIFQLGRAYAAAKDYEKARVYYVQAAALGHALATNNLGALYADGDGVERNLAEARRLYEKAARAGLPLAMSNVGFFFDRGQGGAQDYAQARYWYEKAAEAGIARAAYRLGRLHHYGYGVPKDLGEARRWYERAAESGDGWAMLDLGFIYERGDGVAVDYAKARAWYEKGAVAGNAPAMGNLGALYSRGWGVPQDYTIARSWYERAAAGGNEIAMFNLGLNYQYGQEVPVDYGAARSWYEKAAAKGHSSAMLRLGSLYEEGHGVARDLAEAQRWYEKAAAAGNDKAAEQLARLRQVSETKN